MTNTASDYQLECKLIGAVIDPYASPRVLVGVRELISDERMIEDLTLRIIYHEICEMADTGKPFDFQSLYGHLTKIKATNLNDPELLMLLQKCIDTTGVEAWQHYRDEVYELAQRRTLGLVIAPKIRDAALDRSVPMTKVHEIAESVYRVTSSSRKYRDQLSLRERLKSYYDDPQPVRGYSTGHQDLDRWTHGFGHKALIALIGYSGSGKSTLAAHWVQKFCERGRGLVCTTEMDRTDWQMRIVAQNLGTTYDALKSGEYRDWQLLDAEIQKVEALPIDFLDVANPTGRRLISEVKMTDPEWILVDGLSDMGGREGLGEFEMTTENMKALHYIYQELEKVLLFTVQMNNDSKDRKNKRPNPRDARGSPSKIWQLTTHFFTLHRPAHLVETGEADPTDPIEHPNRAEVRLAKDRFSGNVGKTGYYDFLHGQNPITGRYEHAFVPIALEHIDLRDL